VAVRRIAFVAFVTSALSLLAPTWNLIETISGLVSSGRFSWWQAVPWTVSTWLFSAIMPAFLFVASALYVEYLDPDFHLFFPQDGSSRERADDAAVLRSAAGSDPNTGKSGVPVYRALCSLEEPVASDSRT
jgi:hypothetical protein